MRLRRIGKRAIDATLIAGGAMVVMVALVNETGAIKNQQTSSLPTGIYARDFFAPVEVGSIVWFKAPAALMEFAEKNAPAWAVYFSGRWNGELKPVVAVEGDTVCGDGNSFMVNGARVAWINPELPAWTGCAVLGKGEVAVVSNYTFDSMDSRLYGPVRDVTGPYRLVYSE